MKYRLPLTMVAFSLCFASGTTMADQANQSDVGSFLKSIMNPLENKDADKKDFDQALNNYFIADYIRHRETYNLTTIAEDYNIVRVMSEPQQVYPAFVHLAEPSNQESLAARLGSVGRRRIRIDSITYPQPQAAEVQLTITEKIANDPSVEQAKTVLLHFEYVKIHLTDQERLLNPLGFRITQYQLKDKLEQKAK